MDLDNSAVLHELEIFHIYHVTVCGKKRTRRSIKCAWLVDEIEAYNRPIWWAGSHTAAFIQWCRSWGCP